MPKVRTVTVPGCRGPGLGSPSRCDRPATIAGLCLGHYAQRRRHPGRPLRPLRDPDAPALVNVGIRVTPRTRQAVLADAAGARAALEGWAAKRRR
jgi:hypothetical protein